MMREANWFDCNYLWCEPTCFFAHMTNSFHEQWGVVKQSNADNWLPTAKWRFIQTFFGFHVENRERLGSEQCSWAGLVSSDLLRLRLWLCWPPKFHHQLQLHCNSRSTSFDIATFALFYFRWALHLKWGEIEKTGCISSTWENQWNKSEFGTKKIGLDGRLWKLLFWGIHGESAKFFYSLLDRICSLNVDRTISQGADS